MCSAPSGCVCEAQLMYNWLLDASMSVLISLKVRNFCGKRCLSSLATFRSPAGLSNVGTVFNSIDPSGC